ncbi:hypothetical protein DH2020_042778 [Rehmannia glutinosa]|uniref:SWIM-type domain-containing protein n=1 Tax=Rehmannia glutinosa TaxID=99300 RepID=A0ABR0ULH6_REHGL
MTSNNAESLNSLFKKDRHSPILSLIESIRKKLRNGFMRGVRASAQSQYTSTLTPMIEEKLRKNVDKANRLVADPIDQLTYDVRNGTKNFVVNLDEKTCTCRRFQLEHLPCEHAVAAVKKSGYSIYLFCSLYYTVEYWRATYSDIIYPVPNEVDWEIPENLGFSNVLPPLVRRRCGRTKTKRILSTGEFSQRQKCSRCGATGHNRLTCTSQMPLAC